MFTQSHRFTRIYLILIMLVILAFAVTPVVAQTTTGQVASPPVVDWGSIITTILIAVLVPLAGYATALVTGLAKKWAAEAKQRNPDLYNQLTTIVYGAVQSAEQMGLAGKITNTGIDKFNYANDIAQKWLVAKGLPINLPLIEAAIEEAVKNQGLDHSSQPTIESTAPNVTFVPGTNITNPQLSTASGEPVGPSISYAPTPPATPPTVPPTQ